MPTHRLKDYVGHMEAYIGQYGGGLIQIMAH